MQASSKDGQAMVNLINIESHSCYMGDRTQAHAWGRGCGACPACELRKNGWEKWAQ